MTGPWREPRDETEDYPGLTVHDGRQSGSITAGRSRLPLWAFIHQAVVNGWDDVEDGYSPSDYGTTAESLAGFLYYLLEARGEFGRLLLAIANAERVERQQAAEDSDRHFAEHHPGGNLCACDDRTVPAAWWDDPDLRAPVVDLLRRCLAALDAEDTGVLDI